MNPIVFQFKIRAEDYRKMSYFNTFSIKKFQSVLTVALWVAAVVLLGMDLLDVIQPTDMLHLCFLIVSLTVPLLVLSIEMNVRHYKRDEGKDGMQQRTLTLEAKGIKFRAEAAGQTGFETWEAFMAAYETASLLILYKTASSTVLIPKQNQKEDSLQAARSLLQEKLGKRFYSRV